jgi:hypothetical protein
MSSVQLGRRGGPGRSLWRLSPLSPGAVHITSSLQRTHTSTAASWAWEGQWCCTISSAAFRGKDAPRVPRPGNLAPDPQSVRDEGGEGARSGAAAPSWPLACSTQSVLREPGAYWRCRNDGASESRWRRGRPLLSKHAIRPPLNLSQTACAHLAARPTARPLRPRPRADRSVPTAAASVGEPRHSSRPELPTPFGDMSWGGLCCLTAPLAI